jgi:hypothetical protein
MCESGSAMAGAEIRERGAERYFTMFRPAVLAS